MKTLTVSEYLALDARGRLSYRLFRNPLLMFGVRPIVSLLVGPRIVARDSRPRLRRSVMGTNVALALLISLLVLAIGWQDLLLVQGPTIMLAGAAGIWLFYVQHLCEDAYWQDSGSWSYVDAALRGSSYLKLPRLLRFFSGNIGLHHVHHLNARIPNYNLQRAHDENPIFHQVPTLTLFDGLRAVRLKLWDEEQGRIVGFAEVRGREGHEGPSTEMRHAGLKPTPPDQSRLPVRKNRPPEGEADHVRSRVVPGKDCEGDGHSAAGFDQRSVAAAEAPGRRAGRG